MALARATRATCRFGDEEGFEVASASGIPVMFLRLKGRRRFFGPLRLRSEQAFEPPAESGGHVPLRGTWERSQQPRRRLEANAATPGLYQKLREDVNPFRGGRGAREA